MMYVYIWYIYIIHFFHCMMEHITPTNNFLQFMIKSSNILIKCSCFFFPFFGPCHGRFALWKFPCFFATNRRNRPRDPPELIPRQRCARPRARPTGLVPAAAAMWFVPKRGIGRATGAAKSWGNKINCQDLWWRIFCKLLGLKKWSWNCFMPFFLFSFVLFCVVCVRVISICVYLCAAID